MKVLIDDGMQINVGTGIGKYSKYLFETLKDSSFCQRVDVAAFAPSKGSKQSARLAYIRHINSPGYRRICGKYDIVHFTNYLLPFWRNRRVKYAVTIHDLTSFLHPETFSTAYGIYNRFAIRHAMRYADVVLTVSNAAKEEIVSMWPQYAAKVRLAYPGLYSEFDAKQVSSSYQLPILNTLDKKKFFLFVGTVERRKNLGIVIDSFLQLKKERPNDFKLVLAGRPGFGFEEYHTKINSSFCQSDIICTGYIASEDVQKLYQEAAAYVFPTIYEGFGSTQLECMANHLPLILSDIPTNREISSDYGLFFDLRFMDSLVERMQQIVEGRIDQEKLNAVADAVCDAFQWSSVLPQYIEAYREGMKDEQ